MRRPRFLEEIGHPANRPKLWVSIWSGYATTAGFAPACNWSSASGSPGNKVGSGPSRSCIGVMALLCRAASTPIRRTWRRVAKLQ